MFLYVIGPEIGPQKIGLTKNVKQRIKAIQTGHPQKLFIHHFEEVPDERVRLLEQKIHMELNYKKMKGEWFNISKDEAIGFLKYFVIRYVDDPLLGS